MSKGVSEEQFRNKCIQVMGPEMGGQYYALYVEATRLSTRWNEFKKLYSAERVELLNKTARFFFSVVQDLFREHMLLSLASLADREQTFGNDNLTMQRLRATIRIHGTSREVADQAVKLIDVFLERCEFTKDLRNRHLAHRDLALALDDEPIRPLESFTFGQVEDAVAALTEALRFIHLHYFDSDVSLSYCPHGDVNGLVRYLQSGLKAARETSLSQHGG